MYDIIDKGLDIEKPEEDFAELKKAMDDILRQGKNVTGYAGGFLAQGVDELIKGLTKTTVDKEALTKLEESILNSLNDIDQQIQEKSADTLQQRLDSIYLEYTKLLKKIEEATSMGSEIDFTRARDSINQIVAIKQLEAVEKEINSLIDQRKDAVNEINQLNTTGAITVEEATKRINAENARILPQMDAALAKAREISNKINSAPLNEAVNNLDRRVTADNEAAKLQQVITLQNRLNEAMSLYREQVQNRQFNGSVWIGGEALLKLRGSSRLNDLTNAQVAATIKQMRELVLANKAFAKSFEGQRLLEQLKQTEIELQNVEKKLIDVAEVNRQFASRATDAFEQFISGAASAKDAFRAFIADFLRQIAKAILRKTIFNALQEFPVEASEVFSVQCSTPLRIIQAALLVKPLPDVRCRWRQLREHYQISHWWYRRSEAKRNTIDPAEGEEGSYP